MLMKKTTRPNPADLTRRSLRAPRGILRRVRLGLLT